MPLRNVLTEVLTENLPEKLAECDAFIAFLSP